MNYKLTKGFKVLTRKPFGGLQKDFPPVEHVKNTIFREGGFEPLKHQF
jgi:hypothetical protein